MSVQFIIGLRVGAGATEPLYFIEHVRVTDSPSVTFVETFVSAFAGVSKIQCKIINGL